MNKTPRARLVAMIESATTTRLHFVAKTLDAQANRDEAESLTLELATKEIARREGVRSAALELFAFDETFTGSHYQAVCAAIAS